MAYKSNVYVGLQEAYYVELDKECLSFGMSEQSPWSGPLHRRLPESLDRIGFSKKDWEPSLPCRNGTIPTFSPHAELGGVYTDTKMPQFEPSLTADSEEIDLDRRMRAYHHDAVPLARRCKDDKDELDGEIADMHSPSAADRKARVHEMNNA